jgi:hypothetical protein
MPGAEQVDTDDAVRARQLRDERVPAGQRGRSILDQQQGGRARFAVLHDVYVAHVKRTNRPPAFGSPDMCSATAPSPSESVICRSWGS